MSHHECWVLAMRLRQRTDCIILKARFFQHFFLQKGHFRPFWLCVSCFTTTFDEYITVENIHTYVHRIFSSSRSQLTIDGSIAVYTDFFFWLHPLSSCGWLQAINYYYLSFSCRYICMQETFLSLLAVSPHLIPSHPIHTDDSYVPACRNGHYWGPPRWNV